MSLIISPEHMCIWSIPGSSEIAEKLYIIQQTDYECSFLKFGNGEYWYRSQVPSVSSLFSALIWKDFPNIESFQKIRIMFELV